MKYKIHHPHPRQPALQRGHAERGEEGGWASWAARRGPWRYWGYRGYSNAVPRPCPHADKAEASFQPPPRPWKDRRTERTGHVSPGPVSHGAPRLTSLLASPTLNSSFLSLSVVLRDTQRLGMGNLSLKGLSLGFRCLMEPLQHALLTASRRFQNLPEGSSQAPFSSPTH